VRYITKRDLRTIYKLRCTEIQLLIYKHLICVPENYFSIIKFLRPERQCLKKNLDAQYDIQECVDRERKLVRMRVDCSFWFSVILELFISTHYTQLKLHGRVNVNERINE